MKYYQSFKKVVIQSSSSVIKQYEKAIEQHTGMSLVVGAIFLKSGSLLGSLLVVAPGYLILFSVITYNINKWRDHDE